MRPALVSYFDLGETFGLTDSAFKEDKLVPRPSISTVPVHSPLGWGTAVRVNSVAPEVMTLWRAQALKQVRRHKVVETGWTESLGSRQEFDRELESYVGDHEISFCEITVFAVGVAYVCLQFGSGVPLKYAKGIVGCFEFGAYTRVVSQELARVAREHAHSAVRHADDPLVELTRRRGPQEDRDAEGTVELDLFTSFTRLYLCVDDGDQNDLQELVLSQRGSPDSHLNFEDRGVLHYTWASCVLQPESMGEAVPPSERMKDLEPLLADITIAHVFLGTCEAYMNLVLDETVRQSEASSSRFSKRDHQPPEIGRLRTSSQLNKLRLVSLAAVNLTYFDRVTQSEEDQHYFAKFGDSAHLEEKRNRLISAIEVLSNVQSVIHQEESGRQALALELAVGVLALLTAFSVVVDVYNFLDAERIVNHSEGWVPLPPRWETLGITALIVGAIILFAGLAILLVMVFPRRR